MELPNARHNSHSSIVPQPKGLHDAQRSELCRPAAGQPLCPLQALADFRCLPHQQQPGTLQLTVSQSGSGQLQAGSQWIQHRTELGPGRAPWCSASNRYEGVQAGKHYLFETRVTTAGGDTYRLNQRMEGTWWNSTLQHGGETPTASSGWQNDRAPASHRGPQELAFAAKFTGRYDDLHYMLTHHNSGSSRNRQKTSSRSPATTSGPSR